MRTTLVSLAVVALLGVATFGFAQDQGEPKHTIKEVMQDAHKGGLLKSVTGGEASDADKIKLLDLYISLAESDPPKGHKDDWQAKTNAVVLAAAKVVASRDGASEQLTAATNCTACHKEHRPPAQ